MFEYKSFCWTGKSTGDFEGRDSGGNGASEVRSHAHENEHEQKASEQVRAADSWRGVDTKSWA